MRINTLKIEWVRAHPQSSSVSYEFLSVLEDKIARAAATDRFFDKVISLQRQMSQGDVMAERVSLLARNVAFTSNATSDKDRAVFFSGKHKTSAEYFILTHPHYQAIHTLPVGCLLEKLNLFGHRDISREEAYDIWNIAGRRYAEQASGNVTLIVNGKADSCQGDLSVLAQELPDYGTFRSIELPYLLANDKVQTINSRDKWQYRFLATENFDVFTQSEYQRDSELTRTTRQSKIKNKTLRS